MATTQIEWATQCFNPVIGCKPCSPGCNRCYAERVVKRLKFCNMGNERYYIAAKYRDCEKWDGTLSEFPERWEQPAHWRKPQRVFVGSQSDIALWTPDQIRRVELYASSPPPNPRAAQHKYMVLTKRPELLAEKAGHLLQYCWVGATVCNQAEADAKIPALLSIPAAGHWLCLEPMLEPIDLLSATFSGSGSVSAMEGIDWVVLGGESGKGARPMDVDWVRSIRDQCQAAGVAFWLKQAGSWLEAHPTDGIAYDGNGRVVLGYHLYNELPAGLRLPGEEP